MPTISNKPKTRTVVKHYNDTEVHFNITILSHDVRINGITICNRDIFHIIDPEIRRAAWEDFKHQFLNVEA